MDIVLHNEVPSKGEREAVDSVLGPPESSWDGAEGASERDRVSPAGALPRAPAGTCCCQRCTRCRPGQGGSAAAR